MCDIVYSHEVARLCIQDINLRNNYTEILAFFEEVNEFKNRRVFLYR